MSAAYSGKYFVFSACKQQSTTQVKNMYANGLVVERFCCAECKANVTSDIVCMQLHIDSHRE